jgi:DNA-binding NtrC family response regulator
MRVMVIDDEEDVLNQLVEAIGSSVGPDGNPYEIESNVDYKKALTAEHNGLQFDAVVTDMVMGDHKTEGIEVLKYFAERLPITIVLTAYPSIRNCVEAMKAGAWDYIEKNPSDGSNSYDLLLDSLLRACEHRKRIPQRSEINPDSYWAHDHLKELMRDYPGQLVAVLYESVVDTSNDFDELSRRLRERFPLAKPTIISIPDTRQEQL